MFFFIEKNANFSTDFGACPRPSLASGKLCLYTPPLVMFSKQHQTFFQEFYPKI